MRLPNRKPGKHTFPTFDPHITQTQYDAMHSKLQHILKVSRPKAIAHMQEAGENGDYSENAEYQIAKGRLRGLNTAIDELKFQLAQAIIISPNANTDTVQLGHTVTVRLENNTEVTWNILGPTEANPAAGIISHKSPVGEALLGKQVGEEVTVVLKDRTVMYTIIRIQ